MSNRIHALAQQLTGKATLEECSLDEVRHLVKRYPYFAPAQFLLLQKLKQSSDAEAAQQEKKAILFYHDPLLFNYFIFSDTFYTDESALFEDTYQADRNTQTDDVVKEDEAILEDTSFSDDESSSLITDASKANELHEEIIDPSEEIVPITTPAATIVDESSLDESQIESSKIEGDSQGSVQAETSIAQPHVEQVATKNLNELTFEPFHTVDYFASQGIKISQEELPKDKLGKQLKSFTEWLKTMKRLPSNQNIEASAEKKVESMADRSITESDVVTEAMAEVWAKQGNHQKAEETYNKLSLLNPSKRAYFAAKIENLKHS